VRSGLAAAVRTAHPRPLNPHAPAAQCHLTGLVAVTDSGALRVVLALCTDDLVDLLFHQHGEHTEPDTDAQGQQPLLRRVHQLAERLLHPRRQRQLTARLRGSDLLQRYGLHGGSSSCR
jgi:hypothetical protein